MPLLQLMKSRLQPFEIASAGCFTGALALTALHAYDVHVDDIASKVSYLSMGTIGSKIGYQLTGSIPLYYRMLCNCLGRRKPRSDAQSDGSSSGMQSVGHTTNDSEVVELDEFTVNPVNDSSEGTMLAMKPDCATDHQGSAV